MQEDMRHLSSLGDHSWVQLMLTLMLEPEKLNSTLMEKKSGSHSSHDQSNAHFGMSWEARIKVTISGTEGYTRRINQPEKSGSTDLKIPNLYQR
jgi:hypothetical protein